MLAGVVFAAMLAVVIGVIVAGGSKPKEVDPASSKVAGIAETKTLLNGVEQRGLTLGKASAPLTLVEFLDVQCPFCRQHQLDVQPAVIDRLVRTGKVQLKAQPIAIPAMGEDSVAGRAVLLRLSHENKAWDFLNLFYWNQGDEATGYVTDDYLKQLVNAVPKTTTGVSVTTADWNRNADATIKTSLEKIDKLSTDLGVTGTPTFAIGKTGQPASTYKVVTLSGGESTADQLIAAVNDFKG